MSIDQGQPSRYDAHFPIPGINQPSEQFRTNFQVIRAAVENLQSTANTADSLLAVRTLVGDDGRISAALSYRDNGLTLPVGRPTRPDETGMIAYDATTKRLEYYAGDEWRTVGAATVTLAGDLTGTGTIDSSGTVVVPATLEPDVVTLGYHTTGDYVASLSAGSGIAISAPASESAELVVSVDPADFLNTIIGSVSGLTIVRNGSTGRLDFNVFDPTLAVSGSVTGTARMTNLSDTTILVTARDFGVTLTGGVTGSGIVNDLQDVAIRTTARDFDVALTGSVAGVGTVSDLTDATINTTARDFAVTLTGDVTGTGIVRDLTDVTITTEVGDNSHAHFWVIQPGTVMEAHEFGQGIAGFDAYASPDMPGNDTIARSFYTGLVAMYVGQPAPGDHGTVVFHTRELEKRSGDVSVDGVSSLLSTIPVDNAAWSVSSLVDYAVYVSEDGSTPLDTVETTYQFAYVFTVPFSGPYIVRASCDNQASYRIDGGAPVNIQPFSAEREDAVYLAAGAHDIVFSVRNRETGATPEQWAINPAGVGLSIITDQQSDGVRGMQLATKWNVGLNAPDRVSVRAKDDSQTGWSAWRDLAWTDELAGFASIGEGVGVYKGLNTLTNTHEFKSLTAGNAIRLDGGPAEITVSVDKDFAITLVGDVSGSATVADLGDVTITTTVADDSHNHTSTTITDFTEAVQDVVGGMVTGNNETGITVTYRDTTGRLDFDVNDPTITLTGPVTGSATMVDLGNVSIPTTAKNFTITLNGDVSGAGTVTNLGDVTLTTTVADNSHAHFYTIPNGTTMSPADFGHGMNGFDAYNSPDMPGDVTVPHQYFAGFVAVQGPGTRGMQLAGYWDNELGGPQRVSVRTKDDTQTTWGAWRDLAWADEVASAYLPLAGGSMTGAGDIVFPIVKNGASKGVRWSGLSDSHAIYVEEIANTEVTRLVVEVGDNVSTALQSQPDHMVIRAKAGDGGTSADIATFSPFGVFFNHAVRGVVKVVAANGSLTLDMNAANYFDCTVSGALTLANPQNLTPGQGGFIVLRAANAITYGSMWKFTNSQRPQGSGGVDRLDYLVVSATEIHCSLARGIG